MEISVRAGSTGMGLVTSMYRVNCRPVDTEPTVMKGPKEPGEPMLPSPGPSFPAAKTTTQPASSAAA